MRIALVWLELRKQERVASPPASRELSLILGDFCTVLIDNASAVAACSVAKEKLLPSRRASKPRQLGTTVRANVAGRNKLGKHPRQESDDDPKSPKKSKYKWVYQCHQDQTISFGVISQIRRSQRSTSATGIPFRRA